MLVESLLGILGIHSIKAFSGDSLLWYGHKTEFSFNYQNFFLLKKQNQYPQKFNYVKFLFIKLIYFNTPSSVNGQVETSTQLTKFYAKTTPRALRLVEIFLLVETFL